MAQDFARWLYVSKAWRELRFNLIVEHGPVCQRCSKVVIDTSKLVGHHKIALSPANIKDMDVTLNKDNIDLICSRCHDAAHKRYGYNQHNVYIVYGSPMSGKNTIVNQLSSYGDMVLDIDKLYECISGQSLFDKPNNLRFNVFALRDKMIDMIKTRYGDWHDCYIIGGYPNKQERERLARELGAELIYVDSTKDECLQRVDSSGKKYITKWWGEYVE